MRVEKPCGCVYASEGQPGGRSCEKHSVGDEQAARPVSSVAAKAEKGSEPGELKRPEAPSSRAVVARPPLSNSTPRVLFEAPEYRLVIVSGPDSNGVEVEYPIVELAEGQDRMGHTRWRELEVKDDRWGSRQLARIVHAMGHELSKRT